MHPSLSGRELLFVIAALFLVALLLLGGLAFVAIKILGRRESGETAAGVTGCAVASLFGCLGLLVVFTVGLLAVLLFAGRVVDRVVDHLPAGRWRVDQHEHLPAAEVGETPAELVFRASGEHVDFEPALALIREIVGPEFSTTLTSQIEDGGAPVSELRIGIAAESEELRRIDDELTERAEGLRLEDGSEIEYLGVRRDV